MAAAKKRRFNKKVWREGAPVSLVTLLVGMHIYETMMGNRNPLSRYIQRKWNCYVEEAVAKIQNCLTVPQKITGKDAMVTAGGAERINGDTMIRQLRRTSLLGTWCAAGVVLKVDLCDCDPCWIVCALDIRNCRLIIKYLKIKCSKRLSHISTTVRP